METVTSYLAKYAKLVPPEGSKKKLLIRVVRDECGVSLEEHAIRLQGGGAFLSCHPTIRTEIALCAPSVLATLHREHGVRLAFLR